MKPDWKDIDERFNFLSGDYRGYALWSHKPYKVESSGGTEWVCDYCQSFGNIPDFKSSRRPFLEKRP